jgi:YVTN family beta-propeller protein
MTIGRACFRAASAAAFCVAWCAWSGGVVLAVPDQRVVVLNKGEATGMIFAPGAVEHERKFGTGEGPHEVAITPDGARAVVSNYGGMKPGSTLSVVDLRGNEPVRTIDLGDPARPHGLAFLPGGVRLLVTAEVRQAVLIVNIDTGEVESTIDTDQIATHMVVLAPDAKRAYASNVGSGSLSVIDLAEKKTIRTIVCGKGAEGLDVSPDGKEVWVANNQAGTISIVNAETLELSATIDCPGFPIRVTFTRDGKSVLVSAAQDGGLVIFDPARRERSGRIVLHDPATPLAPAPPDFGDSPIPIGSVVSADSRWAFVALARAGQVASVDLAERRVVRWLNAGVAPDGVAMLPLGAPAGT